MVEAAGVEPASEIAVSQESPCCVRFLLDSLPALRTDKMRQEASPMISRKTTRTEPLTPAY